MQLLNMSTFLTLPLKLPRKLPHTPIYILHGSFDVLPWKPLKLRGGYTWFNDAMEASTTNLPAKTKSVHETMQYAVSYNLRC